MSRLVSPRMLELSLIVLRYFTHNGRTEYERGERVTPTHDEALSAARELRALLDESTT